MPNALSGYDVFLKWLFSTGGINVPTNYHSRCSEINKMLDNDISGTINTVLDYMISSASNATYKVECSNATLEKVLNKWLQKINLNVNGIPTGLGALSTEYFKERWGASSFLLMRTQHHKKIDKIEVPTTMWYVNGGSIYVKRSKGNFKLGSDKYYLDKEKKVELPKGIKEKIFIQKPYNRWFDQYSTPYLIRRGVYKNWLAMKTLQDKSDEVVTKVLPYLFLESAGTEQMFKDGVDYTDGDLDKMMENFKKSMEEYKNQKGEVPYKGDAFDKKYTHLIPDLTNMVKEELYRQGYRAILAGLGMIEMIPVTGETRQQSVLNPKLMIEEVNNGVEGFKAMLLDVIYSIIEKNKEKHIKLFSENVTIKIVNSPLKINVEQILDALRSGYDRGASSIQTYQEILGLDPTTERQRRKKEWDNGDEDLFYPHLINNQEGKDERLSPSQPRKDKKETDEKNEDNDKKKKTPESNNFKNAVTKEELEIAPYKNLNQIPKFIKKMPKHAQEIFMSTFNSVYEKTGDEGKSMSIAINAAKRWCRKNGYVYDKKSKTWKKK